MLDQLRIKYVIGLGDGAGANIMVRFAMMHSGRCLGVILLHPTSNKATMVHNFKEKFSQWKVAHVNPTAENLALFRKFGHKVTEVLYLFFFWGGGVRNPFKDAQSIRQASKILTLHVLRILENIGEREGNATHLES